MSGTDLTKHPEVIAFAAEYIRAVNAAVYEREWPGDPQTLSLSGFEIMVGDGQPEMMDQVRQQMKEALDRVNALRGPTEREKLAARCRELYDVLIEPIREAARECGYSISVHGTIARDIDLIAVPWVRNALPVTDLLSMILEVIALYGGYLPKDDWVGDKPCGRLAFSLYFPGFPYQPYIDLSVVTPDYAGEMPQAPNHKELRAWWDAHAIARIERTSNKGDMERQDALDARKELA